MPNMNGTVKILFCGAVLVLGAVLLTTGCSKSPQQQYASGATIFDGVITSLDQLKVILPRKNGNEMSMAAPGMSGSLSSLIALVPSPAGKAKLQKVSETYDKEIKPALLSVDYDPAAMAKKIDEIKAIVVDVSKEVSK
jgi:hypothetical protein